MAKDTCISEGCTRTSQARNMCNLHYAKWYVENRNNLNNGYVKKTTKGLYKTPDRIITRDGYVMVRIDGIHVAEHRLIMEQKIGRKLTKHESVHHINGIRDDNHPDNLELWVGAIRYGQRASEIVCHNCNEPYKIN